MEERMPLTVLIKKSILGRLNPLMVERIRSGKKMHVFWNCIRNNDRWMHLQNARRDTVWVKEVLRLRWT